MIYVGMEFGFFCVILKCITSTIIGQGILHTLQRNSIPTGSLQINFKMFNYRLRASYMSRIQHKRGCVSSELMDR